MTALCEMTKERVKMPCHYVDCPHFGKCLISKEIATAQPVTNADHIRSMADEELVKLLLDGVAEKVCPNGCDGCDGDCDGRMLNWLKQPYREDA